jgi:hypothetical protein
VRKASVMLCVRLFVEEATRLESVDAPISVLLRSLVVSADEAISKLFRSKLKSNPRPIEGKALGWMSASLQIPEAAWKVGWHDRISARCCVWAGKLCRHQTLKPRFEARASSRLVYIVSTVVEQLSVLKLQQICIPMESNPCLVRAAVPKGMTVDRISAQDFTIIEKAILENDTLEPPAALLALQLLPAFSHGTVIAQRCILL